MRIDWALTAAVGRKRREGKKEEGDVKRKRQEGDRDDALGVSIRPLFRIPKVEAIRNQEVCEDRL